MKPAGLRLNRSTQIVDGKSVPVVMGSMRMILLRWGMLTLCLYLVSWLLPLAWTGTIRMAYLTSGVTWCLFAYSLSRHSLRLCFPVVMLFVLQLWSLFTMVHGWVVLARPPHLGRAELWMLELLIPFFLSACLVYIEPKARDWILKVVLIAFSISCICAMLQFFRIPPFYQIAQSFYAQKDMDFWDGKPGLRAVGLTSHPALLAIQALFCFGIVSSKFVNRKWTTLEMSLLFFYSAIVIFSQARMLMLVLMALWPIVGILMVRRNPVGTLKVACIGTAILIAGIMAAPTRLNYALMSTNPTMDDSYRYRAERRWTQADKIYKQFPITGIGPSSVLFLGDGIPDRYTMDMNLMESGYYVFLAMYGLPGLLVLIFALLATMTICVWVIISPHESESRRSMAFLGLVVTLMVAANSYSANTFDQYMTVPAAMILCGAVLRTKRDEQEAKAERPGIALLRDGPRPGAMVDEEPQEPMAKLRALLG